MKQAAPRVPTILYHYCSSSTLQAIISTTSVRLSSLNLSNDTMEGLWAQERLIDACKEAGLDLLYEGRLRQFLGGMPNFYGGLGLCLSTRGDMLSQWRGYADDGYGFCIGFNAMELLNDVRTPGEHYPTLLEIEYDRFKQIDKLSGLAKKITQLVGKGALANPEGTLLTPVSDARLIEITKQYDSLINAIMSLALFMYGMKNHAFHEEDEWRLFTPYVSDDGKDIYEYAAERDRIKPFRKFPLTHGKNTIERIIIGPRNITPPKIIEQFVQRHLGIDITVVRSSATYR